MTKRNIFIGAAVLTVAGTSGIAGWLVAAKEISRPETLAAASAQPGVAETEGVVTAPVAPATAPLIETPAPVAAYAPLTIVPARPARASRTPITASASEAQPTARNAEPNEPVEPRTEPAEPEKPKEPREPIVPAVPAAPRFVELAIPAGTVLGVRLSTAVSSENAELEDRVEATVTRDVIADGRIAIPSGTRVLGSVNEVTRGGKFRERARIGIRFHTLVLADGTRENVRVDAIVRDGDSPARGTAAKIGGAAVGGAIVGGIMSGKKGALLGGIAGAGAGTAIVATGDRSIAAIAAGTPLSVRLDAPVSVTIERH